MMADNKKAALSKAKGVWLTSKERSNKGKLDRTTSQMREKKGRRYFAQEGVDPLTMAFAAKSTVHAGIGGKPVETGRIPALWEEIMEHPRKDRSTAYIHIPFCRNRCLYCDFYKYPADRSASQSYTDALIRELRVDRGKPAVADYPVHAVYLGGGTPTVLEPDDLTRLFEAVWRTLPLSNDCEITVETSVEDLDETTLAICLAAGVNRFSIGVQSFDTAVRKSLGRRCNRQTVVENLSRARDADAAAVIIDLIYGLPGQNMTVWGERY